MAHYLCLGEGVLQALQQVEQRRLLLGGTGVVRMAVGVKASLVAHPDAVGVIAVGMGADEVEVSCLRHPSVARDVIMVTGMAEAFLMIGNE